MESNHRLGILQAYSTVVSVSDTSPCYHYTTFAMSYSIILQFSIGLSREKIHKNLSAILAVCAAGLPFWQNLSTTPSEEEVGQAGLESNPTQEGPTHIACTLRVEVANLTIGRLGSHKMTATLKVRIIPTITAGAIQARNVIVRKTMHFQHLCHESLRQTRNRLNIFKVINSTNPSIGQAITHSTIKMENTKSQKTSNNTASNRSKQNRIVHIKPFRLEILHSIKLAYHIDRHCQEKK